MTEKVFATYSITEDVLANRPTTPAAPPGLLVIYIATDVPAVYAWSGSAWLTLSSSGGTPALTNTHIFVGNAGNVATDVAMSGDATMANTGAITVTKSSGVAFGSAAFQPTSAFDASGAAAAALVSAEAYTDAAQLLDLKIASNLSDLASASTARTNLGLGSIATHASTDYFAVANNLSEGTPSTMRTNLGLGTAATHAATDFLLAANNLSDVANAGTSRTNLGLVIGTNVEAWSANLDAVAALTTPATTISGAAQKSANLSDLSSASTARTNLGLGSIATHPTTDFFSVANNLSEGVAATMRTNLGLGSAATQASSAFDAAGAAAAALASAEAYSDAKAPPSGGTTGQVLAKNSNTSYDFIWASGLTTTLTSAHLFVGNGSNIATDVALSGDATLSNAGAITVSKSGGVAFGSAAFQPTTAFLAPALTSSHLFVGNGSNVATDVAMSGDATIANTGAITVSKSGGVAFGSAAFQASSAFDAAGAAAAALVTAEAYTDTKVAPFLTYPQILAKVSFGW